MITIAFTNHDITMMGIFVVAMLTIAYVCLILYLYINKTTLEYLYMPLIFCAIIITVVWLAIFSLPCTGFQMIQFGRQVITPDMCSMINSGVF